MLWGGCCAVTSGANPDKVSSLSPHSEESSGKNRVADESAGLSKPNGRHMTNAEVDEKGLFADPSKAFNTTAGPSKPFEEEPNIVGQTREDELMPFRKTGKKTTNKNTAGTESFGLRSRRKSVDCMERYLSTSQKFGSFSAALGSDQPSSSSSMRPVALQPLTKDVIVSNMFVVRGIDWKYGDEDGGDGQVGTVFDFDTKKEIVTVFWHTTQHVGQQYRCGKKCDLAVAPAHASKKISADSALMIARRNSQFMFSMKNQTVIIFDWDDTLFPTTYVRDDMELAWQKPLKDQRLDPREKVDIIKKMEKCEDHVITLLKIAKDLGKVILVTLARNPWVTTSCCNFYERVGKLIEQLNVPIVYAQTGVQVDYDKMAMASNEEIEQYWSSIKGKAIANEVKQFYSQYEGQSWKNIISIGDSDFERLGTQAATADYMKQSGLGSGSDSASQVDGHVFKVRTKTFKLVDQPTIEELTVEVELLQKLLPLMVNLDTGFDVNLSNVEDEEELQRIEKTLQGNSD